MAAVMNLPQNMGATDRIVRGALGGIMLTRGLMHSSSCGFMNVISTLVGGAFLFYGVTGYDPLLQALNTSTRPEDENNVAHKLHLDEMTNNIGGQERSYETAAM